MAIAESTRVWQQSEQSEAALLVLLAIADAANEWGHAWPAQPHLMKYGRLKDQSTVSRIINKLVKTGELAIAQKKGQCNHYLVLVGLGIEEIQRRLRLLTESLPKGYKISTNDLKSLVPEESNDPAIISTNDSGIIRTHATAVLKDDVEPLLEPSIDPTTLGADAPTHENGNGKKLTTWQQRLKDFAIPLCKTAKLDYELNKKRAGSIAAELIKAGYSPDQVPVFEKEWYQREFPGGAKDGKAPSLDAIKKYFAWVNEEPPIPTSPPPLPNYIPPPRPTREESHAAMLETKAAFEAEQRAKMMAKVEQYRKDHPELAAEGDALIEAKRNELLQQKRQQQD